MDLKKYNLDVLGVQETRLEEQEIDLGDHKLFLTDSWLSTAKARQGGVGIAVTNRLAGSIIEQVALSSLVSSFKQRERVCLVGDFNAEPGQQTDVNVPFRGPFGMGEENENSEKLLSFCVSHDLLIGGTWFRHRLVHRYTFNPPDQQMRKKMLDHILFGSRHRSCLHNVRTRRGKITLTDHEMVIAKVGFKVVAHKPRRQPKVCSAKLSDEVTREDFCAEVKRYLDESDIVEGVEQSWGNFRTALKAAATKLLIPEKRVHKPWVTVETLALIRKRAELQLRKHSSAEALLVFSNCCKEVRKALRADKRQWLKDKGETIQDHSDKGDLKEVFGESKQLCRKWSPHISKLVSTTGEPLKTKDERTGIEFPPIDESSGILPNELYTFIIVKEKSSKWMLPST
ncbi:uncharacterized protein LOC142345142 [Convolutriloba macropyga]|uniref:uncharacterized protein LOC142345142 n=1 Tax=Convolutriloba macropyga TaxID=536237 RepID=UPI003F52539A